MDFGIKGKRVLVTGASRGIGAAIARALAKEGCKVSLVARTEDKLKRVLDEIGGTGEGHDYIATDMLEAGAPTEVAKKFLAKHGGFDIIVHNVGGARGRKGPLAPVEDWLHIWQFNAGIPIEMNHLLIPPMKDKRWGRVIHISSISAELGEPLQHPYGGALPYAAAKAYLNAYVKGLGRELAEYNVIVTALMPGVILSEGKYWDKLRKTNPALVDEFLERHCSSKRFGTPEEVAPFAVFMASEQASYASGSLVPIDGGKF